MSRRLATFRAALWMSAAASVLTSSQAAIRRDQATLGQAQLRVSGVRGTQNRVSLKLDGALADLARHALLARPGSRIADLRAMSPAARLRTGPAGTALVAIDAITRGDPRALESALVSLGLQHPAVYRNDVGGWLPVSRIQAAAARPELVSVRAAMPRTRGSGTPGPVATQGDYVQASSALRSTYPSLTGAGVTVGILSDSFNCYAVYGESGSGVPASGAEGYAYNGFTADYATDQSTGALPTGVNVLEEAPCLDYQYDDSDNQPLELPYTDEGRAMLQIVHVVAPDAGLAFYTGANSEADFADGIAALQSAGAKVIADDLGYYDEPFFQDGLIAQAVDTAEAAGVAYFSAAGNDQETPSYQNTAPSFTTLSSSGATSGEYLLNFDTTGATTTTSLPVTIPALAPGEFVAVVVEWDQPYVTGSPDSGGATSQINLCLTGSGGDVLVDYDGDVTSCSGVNALGADPYQVMLIANPATGSANTAAQTIDIQIGLAAGTAPGRIILAVEDDGLGSTINEFSPDGPTLQGHPGAAGAAAVGAAFYFDAPACGTTPATLEPYSSAGGAPILFSLSGSGSSETAVRLATPVTRQKPDFVGPDGVNNTFLGFTLASDSPPYPSNGLLDTSTSECQNEPGYPNFFGTSAATPHAAGIAALLLQANSAATPTQIYQALQNSALPMGATSPNYQSGYGFIQADAALAQLPPGAPTVTLSTSSVTLGGSTTITWSSINATGCTASGNWSGTLAASGSQTLTPSAAGTDTYSLACANAVGTSAVSSATLTVTAASSSSGSGTSTASSSSTTSSSSSSSSGGGAIDLLTLLALAMCSAWRLTRRGPGSS